MEGMLNGSFCHISAKSRPLQLFKAHAHVPDVSPYVCLLLGLCAKDTSKSFSHLPPPPLWDREYADMVLLPSSADQLNRFLHELRDTNKACNKDRCEHLALYRSRYLFLSLLTRLLDTCRCCTRPFHIGARASLVSHGKNYLLIRDQELIRFEFEALPAWFPAQDTQGLPCR